MFFQITNQTYSKINVTRRNFTYNIAFKIVTLIFYNIFFNISHQTDKSSIRAELAIYYLISNKREWNNCFIKNALRIAIFELPSYFR